MNRQCLSIEQMQHLKELGVDTSKASMQYVSNGNDIIFCVPKEGGYEIKGGDNGYIICSTFTLQDILDLLPETIERAEGDFFLEIAKLNGFWYASYIIYVKKGSRFIVMIDEEELIDSAYEMLCWCVENGHFKTAK